MRGAAGFLSRLRWRTRRWVGRLIAAGVDLLQIVVFPAVFPGILSPLNDVIDVLTAVTMTLLFGWNIAFLPAFATELIPLVDVFPTWTLAVLWVTRREQSSQGMTP